MLKLFLSIFFVVLNFKAYTDESNNIPTNKEVQYPSPQREQIPQPTHYSPRPGTEIKGQGHPPEYHPDIPSGVRYYHDPEELRRHDPSYRKR